MATHYRQLLNIYCTSTSQAPNILGTDLDKYNSYHNGNNYGNAVKQSTINICTVMQLQANCKSISAILINKSKKK